MIFNTRKKLRASLKNKWKIEPTCPELLARYYPPVNRKADRGVRRFFASRDVRRFVVQYLAGLIIPTIYWIAYYGGRWIIHGEKFARCDATLVKVLNFVSELDTVSNVSYSTLLLLGLSSLSVYSLILAGWASNSKYAFIGGLRSAAQIISYEVTISLVMLPVTALAGSLNLAVIGITQGLTTSFILPLLPGALIFLVAILAETNRTPFDLPEAEAELVAGYNVDFSALPFAMFFLGEYSNIILMAILFCIMFLSAWIGLTLSSAFILSAKGAVIWLYYVIVRATFPRYRYDQLMDIGWKAFLPLVSALLFINIALLIVSRSAPVVNEIAFYM